MPVLRRCAGKLSIRSSPNRILPRSSSQNPATIRSNVLLPQPDGPSSVKNSPSLTFCEMPSTARTSPKVRATSSIVMSVTALPRAPDDVLDFLQRLGAARGPRVLVIIDDFHVRERRHLS